MLLLLLSTFVVDADAWATIAIAIISVVLSCRRNQHSIECYIYCIHVHRVSFFVFVVSSGIGRVWFVFAVSDPNDICSFFTLRAIYNQPCNLELCGVWSALAGLSFQRSLGLFANVIWTGSKQWTKKFVFLGRARKSENGWKRKRVIDKRVRAEERLVENPEKSFSTNFNGFRTKKKTHPPLDYKNTP